MRIFFQDTAQNPEEQSFNEMELLTEGDIVPGRGVIGFVGMKVLLFMYLGIL